MELISPQKFMTPKSYIRIKIAFMRIWVNFFKLVKNLKIFKAKKQLEMYSGGNPNFKTSAASANNSIYFLNPIII